MACSVCGGLEIELLADFATLPRATSDCRPFPPGGSLGFCAVCRTVQKPATSYWRDETAQIYRAYAIFRQAANGSEQSVFDQTTGTYLRRSEALLKRLQEAYPLPQTGRAVDVGCGNGPTLRALAGMAPQWDLFGHDISDLEAESLASIPNFRKLFVGDVDAIEGTFDLISFCHSVEHIPSPVESLAALRSKLAPGGRLVVEVPDVRQNIYDLVVADHRSHFDALTLADAARRAGFAHVAVYDDWVFKELTLVAANEPVRAIGASPVATRLELGEVKAWVAWLAATLEHARRAAAGSKTFGLFGTAIAATWALGPLAQEVAFFVDEDTARVGQEFEGRPILAPDQVPAGATVFVPLVPKVASAVARRLNELGVDVRVPPLQEFACNHS